MVRTISGEPNHALFVSRDTLPQRCNTIWAGTQGSFRQMRELSRSHVGSGVSQSISHGRLRAHGQQEPTIRRNTLLHRLFRYAVQIFSPGVRAHEECCLTIISAADNDAPARLDRRTVVCPVAHSARGAIRRRTPRNLGPKHPLPQRHTSATVQKDTVATPAPERNSS